jgi:hypothetical protein
VARPVRETAMKALQEADSWTVGVTYDDPS